MKALDTFRQRIWLITRRVRGCSMAKVAEQVRDHRPGRKGGS